MHIIENELYKEKKKNCGWLTKIRIKKDLYAYVYKHTYTYIEIYPQNGPMYWYIRILGRCSQNFF